MVAGVRLLACGRLAVRAVFSASAVDLGGSFYRFVSKKTLGAALAAEQPHPPQKRPFATSTAKGDVAQPVPQPGTNVVATCAGFPKVICRFYSHSIQLGYDKRPLDSTEFRSIWRRCLFHFKIQEHRCRRFVFLLILVKSS